MRVIVVGAGVIGCSAAFALARGWTGEHVAAAIFEGAALPAVVAPGRFSAAVAL